MLLGVQVTAGLGFFCVQYVYAFVKIEALCSTSLTFYGRNVCMCYHMIIYKPPTSAPPVKDFCLLKVLVHLIDVTKSAKIDHLSTKNHQFFSTLLYHNFKTDYIISTKSSPLLQHCFGFLLQLTELRYYVLHGG